LFKVDIVTTELGFPPNQPPEARTYVQEVDLVSSCNEEVSGTLKGETPVAFVSLLWARGLYPLGGPI
jgi:hypothetical protein